MEEDVVDFVIDSSLESFAWLRKRLSRMSIQQADFFFACVYSLILMIDARFYPDKEFRANRMEKTFKLSFSEAKDPYWKHYSAWNFNRLIEDMAFMLSKDKKSFVRIEKERGAYDGSAESYLLYDVMKRRSKWLQEARKALWRKENPCCFLSYAT